MYRAAVWSDGGRTRGLRGRTVVSTAMRSLLDVARFWLDRARTALPMIFVAIGALLIVYGLFLDRVLDLIGTFPYSLRMLACFALIFPPAFLMGFPMPTAMTVTRATFTPTSCATPRFWVVARIARPSLVWLSMR